MKIVYVEWLDSMGEGGWITLRTAVERQDEPMLCRTVGWLVMEGEQSLIVTHTYREDEQAGDDVMGCLAIPWCAITRYEHVTFD